MTERPTPTKGHPVELDRVRHLRFPLATLQRIQEDQSLGNVLFQGLRHEDPDLTIEDVEEMVSLDMIDDLVEPLKKATGGLVDLDQLFAAADAMMANALKADPDGAPKKKGPAGEKGPTSGS